MTVVLYVHTYVQYAQSWYSLTQLPPETADYDYCQKKVYPQKESVEFWLLLECLMYQSLFARLCSIEGVDRDHEIVSISMPAYTSCITSQLFLQSEQEWSHNL